MVCRRQLTLVLLLFSPITASASAGEYGRSAPTAAESVRVVVIEEAVDTRVPYLVIRRSSQIDNASSIVSSEPRNPAPQIPRARPGYAYGWFGVSPRTHQQHKPSVYGLEQRYEWK